MWMHGSLTLGPCRGPQGFGVGLVGVAVAVAAGAISAAPLSGQLAVDRLEMTMRAVGGAIEPGVINVRNSSDETVQATVTLEDWDRGEDGGNRWYEPGSVHGACADRLEVFPRALSLDAGASQSVRVSFRGNAELARECWGAVVLATTPPPVEGSGISHVIRTAVKVYVPPALTRAAVEVAAVEIAAVEAADEVRVDFANTGNVHVISRATLQIRTPDNVVAHELELPPAYLLPGARGRVAVPMPALAPGRYVLLAIADYGGAELAAAQVEHEVP
jgi:P pilus assembly chaperone PapD